MRCVKCLCEVGTGGYSEVWRAVGRHKDTNRSDRVCYVRLGTAFYSEVWRNVGRYRDTNRSGSLLREVRMFLLQWSVTYCGTVRDTNLRDRVCYVKLETACYSEVWRAVGRYRDTNRSDRVFRVCNHGCEVRTAVSGCSRLNMTGNAVKQREMHQQRTMPTGFQGVQFTLWKFKVSPENKM